MPAGLWGRAARPAVHLAALIPQLVGWPRGDRLRPLRGKAAGDESLLRRRFRGRRRRTCLLFLDLGASSHVLAAAGAGRFKSVVLRPTVTVLGGKTAKRQK